MSTTPSIEKIPEVLYTSGPRTELLKKIVRLALCDLASNKAKLRKNAHRYFLSKQFNEDCDELEIGYNYILKTVALTIELKNVQKRAIINKLLEQLGV